MIVYDKELERDILAHKDEFEIATKQANHDWYRVNSLRRSLNGLQLLSTGMPTSSRQTICSSSSNRSSQDSSLTRSGRFSIAKTVRASVVAVYGVGALLVLLACLQVLKLVEPSIRGRLVIFFPGQYEQNNYRLLDARDGWNYLAVPITLDSAGLA